MRIKAPLIFALIFVSIISGIQVEKYDFFTRQKFSFESFELKKIKDAKVKVRKMYSAYYNKDQKLPDKLTLVEEIIFNTLGNPIEKNHFNSLGGIRTKYEYEYDKMNRLITEVVIDDYGNISNRKEITYNANNDTAQIVIHRSRKSESKKKVFEYYDDAKLKQIRHYDHNDKLYVKELYKYKNGKLESVDYYNSDQKRINKVEFIYNKYGSIIEEKFIDYKKTFTYDNKNRLIKADDRNKIRLYKYDDMNNIIDDQYFIEKTKRQFKLIFSYLKNGLANDVIRYDALDRKAFYSKYEYEYYK